LIPTTHFIGKRGQTRNSLFNFVFMSVFDVNHFGHTKEQYM